MFQEVRKIQGLMATDLDLDSCRSLVDTAIYPKSNHNSQKMSQSQSHPAGKGSQLSHEQLRCDFHFIILFTGPIFFHTWAPWQLCHCACPWSHLLRSLVFLGGEFFHSVIFLKLGWSSSLYLPPQPVETWLSSRDSHQTSPRVCQNMMTLEDISFLTLQHL